jgi:hypothetical protein
VIEPIRPLAGLHGGVLWVPLVGSHGMFGACRAAGIGGPIDVSCEGHPFLTLMALLSAILIHFGRINNDIW